MRMSRKNEILLFSPGKVILGILVPVLTDLRAKFALTANTEQQISTLSNGLLLNSKQGTKILSPKIVSSPNLADYETIIVSVGYFSVANVIKSIQYRAPKTKIIIAENLLMDEVRLLGNIKPMVVDRIITTRNFDGNKATVNSESYLKIKSSIEIFKEHHSHEIISDMELERALLDKFLNVNVLHKIAAIMTLHYGYKSINEYFLYNRNDEFSDVIMDLLSFQDNKSNHDNIAKFLLRLENVPFDPITRITNTKGTKLFFDRLRRLKIPSDKLLKYL